MTRSVDILKRNKKLEFNINRESTQRPIQMTAHSNECSLVLLIYYRTNMRDHLWYNKS